MRAIAHVDEGSPASIKETGAMMPALMKFLASVGVNWCDVITSIFIPIQVLLEKASNRAQFLK